jgi:hypothetical protein
MSLKYEIEVDSSISTTYRQHGQRHRVNGPAILWNDGDQWWYQYGKLHRTNGPAKLIIFRNRPIMEHFHRGQRTLHIPRVKYVKI